MKNNVQLITYVDRLTAGQGFKALRQLLNGPLKGLFGGVHVLPFFDPIDGADAGFDPKDHTAVDARLGDWNDVAALAKDVEVMADVIVNHMSSDSPQFLDFEKNGTRSVYKDLFLTLDSVFPNGATEADLLAIYRPRPGLPFSVKTLANGERRLFWTTFTPSQLDIDVHSKAGQEYLLGILDRFSQNGIKQIRLDATGYAIKRAGTSCFMLPETFEFIEEFSALARARHLEVLVEIHAYYQQQINIAQQVDWVYDFALPPLLLHAIAFKTAKPLAHWIKIRPNNAVNVLDTHDGIGIIDIGADASDRQSRPGLVPDPELDALVDWMHENAHQTSRKATGAMASNLDLYQVNCTYYEALGSHDEKYLMARAVQLFMPGIPQIYYVGLLAGLNDMELLEKTRVGRDINRHYYSQDEINLNLKRPVVQRLCELIRLRNTHPAFNGEFQSQLVNDHQLALSWTNGAQEVTLKVDFAAYTFEINSK
jgi:sucrose phosphorylase